MNIEIATTLENLKSNVQALLNQQSNDLPSIFTLCGEYLREHRTAGIHIPKFMIDYTLFADYLKDRTTKTVFIFPNLDGWAALHNTFSCDDPDKKLLRVFDNDESNLIDFYVIGSKSWEKYIKLLKIDPSTDKIFRVNNTHFREKHVIKECPRGFCFYIRAERNNFPVKKLMARYLRYVFTFANIENHVKKDLSLTPQLEITEPRTKLDKVIIYDSHRFFDKVRKTKFYDWLSTQAHGKTEIILIN